MRIVSDTEVRIAMLSGAVILLQPGQEREVSDEIGLVAVQMGARALSGMPSPEEDQPVEDEVEIELEEEPVEEEPKAPTLREGLVEAFIEIINEGNPDDFKADGGVKAAVINKKMGDTIPPEEREAAWQEALNR
jgi:hypothetical protein|tara:strand:- start:546 stop:947 length:402 start_codon:yes stop_codon:yes gene_type:complete